MKLTDIPGTTALSFPDLGGLGAALIVVFILVAAAVVALSFRGSHK